MSAESEDNIWEEFNETLRELAFMFGMFRDEGCKLILKHYQPLDPAYPMQRGVGAPGDPSAFEYAQMRGTDVRLALQPNGLFGDRLGAQWLVMVDALWEDDIRDRLSKVRGCASKKEVLDPVMADLRNVRNDVVHHRSVATQRNSGSCKTLSWFKPGERIVIEDKHMYEFMKQRGLTRPVPGPRPIVPGMKI